MIRPPTRDLHLILKLNKTTKYNRAEEFSKPVHKTCGVQDKSNRNGRGNIQLPLKRTLLRENDVFIGAS